VIGIFSVKSSALNVPTLVSNITIVVILANRWIGFMGGDVNNLVLLWSSNKFWITSWERAIKDTTAAKWEIG
jgi:hypothetical protein